MKAVLFLLAFAIGLFFGFYPALHKPRPLYWRILTIIILTSMIVLALFPHTAGTFSDAIVNYRMGVKHDIPVKIKLLPETKIIENHQVSYQATDFTGSTIKFTVLFNENRTDLLQIESASSAIVLMHREGIDNSFQAGETVSLNPMITLPFIIGLEERARILYFHVPMSWIAVLAYIVAMIYAGRYLARKNIRDDITSSSAAALGTLFCLLATVTGSIWAKFNWGSFWNWDPRETSIFVLLLIYAAYFALRAAVENEERRARLSAVYAILAAVTVPFFIFILPRITEGLHPGSKGDANIGPVLSPQAEALNPLKQIILSLSFAGFTLIFFWMLSLQIRVKTITMQLLERHNTNER
ncbi:MAG: cytochrome c biogenesis protein CcsA [Ignavibacteriae bacterium]|nr:cytochrome c biogenesis protein CcsA [Ignavibacteriota bacterium]